jgi:hypothetical protein
MDDPARVPSLTARANGHAADARLSTYSVVHGYVVQVAGKFGRKFTQTRLLDAPSNPAKRCKGLARK